VFTIVFGKLANLPSEGDAPYPIMVFAAMLPWQFFASALSECSNSLITNANLMSKVYFPSPGGAYQCGGCELCRLYDFGDYSAGADGLV
jgi:hypothetical protein